MEHSWVALGIFPIQLAHHRSVQGIFHPWVLRTETQAVNHVCEVQAPVLEWYEIMDMHAPPLVGPPRREMEVTGDLVDFQASPYLASLPLLLGESMLLGLVITLFHIPRVDHQPPLPAISLVDLHRRVCMTKGGETRAFQNRFEENPLPTVVKGMLETT